MCFSLGWAEHVLIWIVVLIAVIAVLRLVLPWLLGLVGAAISLGPIPRIIDIVVGAVIAIAVIMFIFELLGCLVR